MRKKVKREYTAKFEDGIIKKLNGYEILEDGTCTLEFDVEIEVEEPKPKQQQSETKVETLQTKSDTSNANSNSANQNYIIVDVENLSLDDEFTKFQTQTTYEKSFRGELFTVIKKNKLKNFCKPIYDPSISGNQGIAFASNMDPALGMSFKQWFEIARTINPSKNSRIGSRDEYIAFLGFLIKKMVEAGVPIEKAWNSVCDDSSNIGVYASEVSFQNVLRKTGSKGICGFYDLANTQKVLLSDLSYAANYYWKAGGTYKDQGSRKPLVTFEFYTDSITPLTDSVGWIIWDV